MDARASRSNLPFDATFTGWDNIQKFWAIEWTCACHNERYVTIDDKGSMIPGYLLYAVYIYGNILPSYIAQMLHVWNIYLHLPLKSTKCGYIYHTCSIWVGIITSHYKDPGSLLTNQDFMEGQARVVTLPLLTCLQRTYVRE